MSLFVAHPNDALVLRLHALEMLLEKRLRLR
jgi:hypothetical protein